MGLYKYSHKTKDEKKVARAQVHDVNASYKDLTQVMNAIRGKKYEEAVKILEETIAMRMPIRYRQHATNLGHRPQLGGRKGRFPKKEAKIVIDLLKNAKANADSKGLENLRVSAAAAHKQDVFMRYRKYFASGIIIGYGRQSFASKLVTAWVEIALEEIPGAKKKEAKVDKTVKIQTKIETKPAQARLAEGKVEKKEVKKEEKKVEKQVETAMVTA